MTLQDVLEPSACAAGEATPEISASEVAALSLAISLKRIADVLAESTIQVGADRRIIEATVRRQN